MKKLLLAMTVLCSLTSVASKDVPVGTYKGNIVGSEKNCHMKLSIKKDKVKAKVHGNKKRMSFSNWSYRLGDEETFAVLEKGGMTEMCDYWDLCLFNTPLKSLYIEHDESGAPVNFELTTERDWRVDSQEKTIINCENLKKVI